MNEDQETTASSEAIVENATVPAMLEETADVSSSAENNATTSKPPTCINPTRPSGLPKPSGLKPPSKIGRLCSNSAPKPAVPVSPRSDGSSSDTLRKSSDEFSRKHLSDLVEAEEEGEISSSIYTERSRPYRKASTGSTYSGTSMDALWERHPRRLSEAGLRRSSDHSVVLTEDTDSFIIGDRVWVGGTKSGQIAYIGETQFAPGEWAGIVLDDPIGKNDGSVAGVRYFQCAERRGVFSRLTRLTRSPLPGALMHDMSPSSDAGSVFERPPSARRRAASPNGSMRSGISSRMNASITTGGGDRSELRMGDRVIVSSSRGSKAGTLRYVGSTQFASGVWAGVELDDPIGKNDGSVEGQRYFECAPRFGLFAPISKVSRSPSNRKPGACAIHSNGRTTPLRRSNSRDSLLSLGTSIASSRPTARLGTQRVGAPRVSSTPVSAKNALQEMLREKQHHLERLLMERELERSEVVKTSMQAERAEQALALLKKDTEQINTENNKLKEELSALNKLLEDERQKVEDLLFRNEEENINKEDYNKYKESMELELAALEARVREVTAESELQKARAEASAATLHALSEQRQADLATLSEQHRDELTAAQSLSSELQKLLDEAYALLKEKENEKDSLGKSMTEELSRIKTESEKALNEAKSKITIAQTEFETQISVLSGKLQLTESKLDAEKQNSERIIKEHSEIVSELNSKLAQLQATADDKTQELNKVLGTAKEHELNLNKEITKLKMELSAKLFDVEQLTETNKKQENINKNLADEITSVKEEYSTKMNEYESLLNEASQENEKNKNEIVQLKQNLTSKTKEYEKLLNEKHSANDTSEKLINEYRQIIHERDKEIIRLKDDYEEANANFNIKQSLIAEEHKKEIDERNNKIDQLLKEIENTKNTLNQNKTEFDTLHLQLTSNIDEIEKLKTQNSDLQKSIQELTLQNEEFKKKIMASELQILDLQKQLQSSEEKCLELQTSKEKLELEYLNLTGQTTDSNEQFTKLSQHLSETEKDLQNARDKNRELSNTHNRIEQELKQEIFKLQEDFSNERNHFLKTIEENIEKQKGHESILKEFEGKVVATDQILKNKDIQINQLLDNISALKSDIQLLKDKETNIIVSHQKSNNNMDAEIEKYKKEIMQLKKEGESAEIKLKEKVDQLTEAQNDLNNKLEEALNNEGTLQIVINDMTSQLNNQKAHYERDLSQSQSQLLALKEDSNNNKIEESKLKQLLQQKENEIKELNLKNQMYEVELQSNLEIINEKERQFATISDELNKVLEERKAAEIKLNETSTELASTKLQCNTMEQTAHIDGCLIDKMQTQFEDLSDQVSELTNAKVNILLDLSKVTNDYDLLTEEHNKVQKKLKASLAKNDELEKIISEKDSIVKCQSDKSETESNKLIQLENELCKIGKDLLEKDTHIKEKESELAKFKEILESSGKDTQKKLEEQCEENKKLEEKYKSQIEILNKNVIALQSQATEHEKEAQELKQSQGKVTELQNLLKKSEDDIKQLTNINSGQKSNYEDLNKQLQAQYDDYRRENKKVRSELKSKLSDYEKELLEIKANFDSEVERHNQDQQALKESKDQITELRNQIEVFTLQQNNIKNDDKLEKLTLELQATRKNNNDSIASHELALNNLKKDLAAKETDLKSKNDAMDKLNEELKKQIVKAEIAEREKLHLQKELSIRSNLESHDDKTKEHLETESVDGQVSFLNSVIVEMQRKNEQLMARVQALESGASTPEPPFYNSKKPRLVAPRLFCDICEVFDAHDTEDCPRQGAEPQTPKKPPPPPRPYCDICEVFGHTTENCEEDETY